MKKILLITSFMLALLPAPNKEQFNIEITGTVTALVDGLPLPQVSVFEKGTSNGVPTDKNGHYRIKVQSEKSVLVFKYLGFVSQEVKVGKQRIINVQMETDATALGEVVVTGYGRKRRLFGSRSRKSQFLAPPGRLEVEEEVFFNLDMSLPSDTDANLIYQYPELQNNTESYKKIEEVGFKAPLKDPLSTFSIDVDAASYSNVRRFINNGQRPPKDAVRIEEMINYFNYEYDQPSGNRPFAVHTEVSSAPWNKKHQLVHIGLQGKQIENENLPASNLVFLLDVSGSMSDSNKLPLVKSSLKMLTNQLRPQDRVAIVVYAGAAGQVLPSTSGSEKRKIISSLNKLNAGGSTAGGAGIKLAYKIAKENFIEGGNNRIILATDGDFNVGASSDEAMEELIEKKRKEGVFLTVLGFGMHNYKDSKMEILADKGNGNYAYIDNSTEAHKVLVSEFGGTMYTIAKDVKIQVEFNPGTVQAYRLIGYENRTLAAEDFNNDKKDAGELGSGHTVTALYEVIPVGVNSSFKPIDDLKYQENRKERKVLNTKDLMTVKLRYKQPDGETSQLIQQVIRTSKFSGEMSQNFRWSAAVAGFGMLLRDSDYSNDLDMSEVIAMAKSARGEDEEGYRSELIKLMKSWNALNE